MIGNLVSCIFQDGIHNVIMMGENSGMDRNKLQFCHYFLTSEVYS